MLNETQLPLSLADYLLSHLVQECAEVIVRATKAQHFGLNEMQPEQPHTNAERVMHEWCDLVATMETLQEYGILPELRREEYVQRKKDKRGKAALFREYSRKLERLHSGSVQGHRMSCVRGNELAAKYQATLEHRHAAKQLEEIQNCDNCDLCEDHHG